MFLNPLALSFLALGPVIVLLYLLKVKRRPVTVPALFFWRKILQENRRRSLFQRLRRLLSLLLHLLIFLLILIALARPELNRVIGMESSTVLVVDTRARMQALESGHRSRMEKVKELLGPYAAQAGGSNQVALLAADGSADVRVPFSADQREIQAGIDSLRADDCGGSLDPALDLAARLLASRGGRKRIVVFSDRPVELHGASPDIKLESVPVGSSRDNIAILQFAARSVPSSPDTTEVLLEIANFSAKSAVGNADISLDGNLIDVMPFSLEPGARKQIVFSSLPALRPEARGWLAARLENTDSLAVDNEAWAALPPRDPARVLLVTKGNWFIEKMLQADHEVRFDLLTPDAFHPDQAANFDAVILDDCVPPALDLARMKGNILFIKSTPFFSAEPPLSQPLVTDTDPSSPLLRLVSLRNVTFLRAAALDFQDSLGDWRFDAPLRSFDHPLVITGQKRLPGGGEQRMAAFAFDVAESDLPLRVAFPLLMANTVQWLAGESSFPAAAGFRAGEMIDPGPGGSLSTVPLRPQGAIPSPLPASATLVTGPFRPVSNGFYALERNGRTTWIAVNTFDEAESDLRFTAAPAAGVAEASAWLGERLALFSAWPLWMDFALAAFLLFSLEWWLFHRRHTE